MYNSHITHQVSLNQNWKKAKMEVKQATRLFGISNLIHYD